MVGPLSTEEIEDVVSSVRRLVSNEQRPRTLSRDLNFETLLLTPALRVVSETSALSPLILASPLVEPPVEPPVEPVVVAADQPDVAALAAYVEPDVTPDQLVSESADLAEPLADEVEEAPMLVEAEWEDGLWPDPEPPLAEAALEAEVAEMLTSLAEVEIADPDIMQSTKMDWSENAPIPFVAARRLSEVSAEPQASPELVVDAKPDPFKPVAANLPEAIVEAIIGDDIADLVADDEDAEARAPLQRQTELMDEDGTTLEVLDESALKDMVRLLIRQELQSELGERVTRNVRKLVRAEINRALIARDLD